MRYCGELSYSERLVRWGSAGLGAASRSAFRALQCFLKALKERTSLNIR